MRKLRNLSAFGHAILLNQSLGSCGAVALVLHYQESVYTTATHLLREYDFIEWRNMPKNTKKLGASGWR